MTFDANGASGQVPSPVSVSRGASFTAPAVGAMKKTGYHFMGWAKLADAKTADYSAGATVTDISANITLYAVWEADKQSPPSPTPTPMPTSTPVPSPAAAGGFIKGPHTGDSSNIALLLALMLASGAGAVLLLSKSRKQS